MRRFWRVSPCPTCGSPIASPCRERRGWHVLAVAAHAHRRFLAASKLAFLPALILAWALFLGAHLVSDWPCCRHIASLTPSDFRR